MNKRGKRGSVSITTRNKMLRLRWTYQGKEYYLALGCSDTPFNRTLAKRKAASIEADLAYGAFEPSLEKYKDKPVPVPQEVRAQSTVELFIAFMEARQADGSTSGQAISSRYKPLLSNLKRFHKDIASEELAREFVDYLRSRQSPLIANQNLSLLKGFGTWAIEKEHITSNLFQVIKPLKVSHVVSPTRLPFTATETRKFLDAAKLHPRWHSYHDFCMALLYLGLRPSEGIGLRWRHIDWQRRTIHLSESLSRSADGRTAGYARQKKSTKNQKFRVIDMHPDLYAMLQGRFTPGVNPDDLIFTTVKGKAIDDHNFSQRTWRDLCKAAGIEYRVPYAARHSLGSHLLENGATIPQVAAVLSNRPETTARHYAHAINRPTMPGF
jgi:integrase